MSAPDFSRGLEELAGLISFYVGAWHDFGYETPPAPDCASIPPLGERSASAVKAGHEAIEAIDELTRQLHALRGQLAGELRQDSGIRASAIAAESIASGTPVIVEDDEAEPEATPEERLLLAIYGADPGDAHNVRELRKHAVTCTKDDHGYCLACLSGIPGDGEDDGRCAADWGSATASQRCIFVPGHPGLHQDAKGHEWGEL